MNYFDSSAKLPPGFSCEQVRAILKPDDYHWFMIKYDTNPLNSLDAL